MISEENLHHADEPTEEKVKSQLRLFECVKGSYSCLVVSIILAIDTFMTYVDRVDPLADVLNIARVDGAIMAQVRAAEPWGLKLAPTSGAAFHVITSGMCWLRIDGNQPIKLMPGDVVLLPSGIGHTLSSTPRGQARAFDRVAKRRLMSPSGDLDLGGTGIETRFLCASYAYDHDVAQPLMVLLPNVLHLSAGDHTTGPIEATLRLLTHEIRGADPGSRAVVNRLIDILLVHVLRVWLAEHDGGSPSWLHALRDSEVARALTALHAHPERPWTVATLAAEVGVSRATLARRFPEHVGETPLIYLTRWRMELAAQRLRGTNETVDSVARAVGYSSEFAFSRAFSRVRGAPPGRYRANHKQEARNSVPREGAVNF